MNIVHSLSHIDFSLANTTGIL